VDGEKSVFKRGNGATYGEFAHLHLLLNHFPIIGTMVGLGLFLLPLSKKNQDLRRASYIIFAAIALIAIPTFMTGYSAWI